MPLSWNEIRARAHRFAENWSKAKRERADAQSFWNDFFGVFGIADASGSRFSNIRCKKIKGGVGFIDLFWPGVLLVEHKSGGLFDTAAGQIEDYLLALPQEETPRYTLACDFRDIRTEGLKRGRIMAFLARRFGGQCRALRFRRRLRKARFPRRKSGRPQGGGIDGRRLRRFARGGLPRRVGAIFNAIAVLLFRRRFGDFSGERNARRFFAQSHARGRHGFRQLRCRIFSRFSTRPPPSG